ncbi:MAG: tetratricopeptide repeat protein [Candidatus Omnitrophota bacterium]
MSLATILDKINPILKKANYVISLLLVVAFFFVLMTHLNREVRDLDIWLHLKAGEQIILNKEVPLNDPFSFTKEGQPWINHEWLFQILSYVSFTNYGVDGLIVMQNIVFIAIFLILLAMGLRKRNFLFVSVVLFILMLNSSYRFTIRPDMFSVLFLVIFIFILKEKPKYVNLLPFLQIIWTNFHGLFFMGPLLILIFGLFGKNRKVLVVFAFSVLATIINPQFIKGALYPVQTLFSACKDRFIFDFIQELKKPITFKTIFNLKEWLYFKAFIFISLFSFRFNQKRFNITLFLLWFLSLLLSLLAIRNIIYFSIIATIAIFYNVKERLSYDSNFSNEKIEKNKLYYLGRFSLIFAFSFCMLKNSFLNIDCHYYDFDSYNFKSCLWGDSQRNFPKDAVDFMVQERLPIRLFNDFNVGSYLINRAYPLRKVFIDGRTEFYGNKFLRLYKDVTSGKKDAIDEIVTRYNLEGFILTMAMSNFDEELAKFLFEDKDWKAVYFDETAFIFLKDTPNNKDLIDKHYIDLKQWMPPNENLEKIGPVIVFPYENIKRGEALKALGCLDAAIREAKIALKLMPNYYDAFKLLGNCYFEKEDYKPAIENLRIAVALAPKYAELRNKYAQSLYKLGFLEEAERQLLKLTKDSPKTSEYYFALAKVYKKLNDLGKTEQAIENANKFSNNQNSEHLKFWAQLLLELKEYNKAKEIYKIAQQLQPEDTEVSGNLIKLEKML